MYYKYTTLFLLGCCDEFASSQSEKFFDKIFFDKVASRARSGQEATLQKTGEKLLLNSLDSSNADDYNRSI